MRPCLATTCLLFLAASLASPALHAQATPWQIETSGTTASLRGIHASGGGVAWASGTNGTVLRTEDSGYMWQSCAMPPGAEKLDFRAIWAWDANTAIVMSSGPGDQSRLYKTMDGCSHWTLLYTNPDKDGFWDALVFDTRSRGYLLGDPVNFRFVLLLTEDGGLTWKSSQAPGLEVGFDSRGGAFAASNSSLLSTADRSLFFGTAGAYLYTHWRRGTLDPHIAHSGGGDMEERWTRATTPLARSGESAGIFSLAARQLEPSDAPLLLVAVGGDYGKPKEREGTAARSVDSGAHWALSSIPPGGYRSAVAFDPEHNLWITVGPTGSDVSRDDGKTWQAIEYAPNSMGKAGEWNALSLPWVVGPNGRIAKLNVEALPKSSSPDAHK